MHLPYDSIRRVDISSSGTVVAQLLSPPQCHETLQVISDNVSITMTIVIASNSVEHFVRTLRIRGLVRLLRPLSWLLCNMSQTDRIKLNGIPLQRATVRTSVNISPTRLEFEGGQSVASYQVRRANSGADWLM